MRNKIILRCDKYLRAYANAAIFLPALFFLFLSLSCKDAAAPSGDRERLSVFVNIPPQAYFVEQIGGELADVRVLVSPGENPHMFTPTPRQIMHLGNADIYFHGIMPFGKAIAGKIAGSGSAVHIVDITEGIDLRPVDGQCDHDHAHDAGGVDGHDTHHRHNGDVMDPHVWLSPPEIKVQARNIADALKEADPARAGVYERNLNEFVGRTEEVHRRLTDILEPLRGRTFYVYHPAFGYFARTYGLVQEAVETGGRSPAPRHIRELIKKAGQEGVRVLFVQPQFDHRSAQTIADAINGVVIPLDPLAHDVLENLVEIAGRIESALGGDAGR